MVRQCVFWNKDGEFHSGIYFHFDNGDEYIVNAEDGTIISVNETKQLRVLDWWVNLDYEIKYHRPIEQYDTPGTLVDLNGY